MAKRHWSERLSCSCGASFRSYAAEAKHRHNFPLLCRGDTTLRDKVVGALLKKTTVDEKKDK